MIKLLKTKDKGRTSKAVGEQWHLTYKGKNLNDRVFLIRCHGDQKEAPQCFSSAERKWLSTQKSISTENILKEWREMKTFLDERKLREFVTSKPTLK